MFTDALVKGFIAAGYQGNLGVSGQFPGYYLVEKASLRAEQDNRAAGRVSENTFNGIKNGFRLHDHTPAAAIRGVIGGVMTVGGPLADVMRLYFQQTILDSSLEN